ncbi:ATP-binding protein [bacterium]|nr:ATP-binding protein [bacterium]
MERKIYADLLKWKKDPNRKPLLIYGNKQIGKTYTTVEFGEREYKTVSYINSDNNLELLKIMQKERTIDKIIAKLSLLTGESILKNDTLIIIDNVIDDDIVKAVKKFGKEPNDYHIIMITSLKEKLLTFKGEELQYKYMFPMDFEEYLRAVGNIELIDFIKSSYRSNKPMPFHNIAMDYYEEFLITGGLPESIEANIRKETDLKIRLIHEKQLDTYKKEFLYLNNLIDITRCNEVLNILPYQLLKTNRKFQYGLMRTGGRSKDYEKALEFLSANGIAYKCYKISEVKPPLSKCKDPESFKLYLNDTGVLFMMMHLSKMKLFTDDNLKYILYENNLASAIISSGYNLYYYQSEGKAEVPFVVQTRAGKVIPIEIVNKNLSKAKSLSLFMSKFNITEAIRFTEDNFSIKKGIKYVPIYAAFCLKENL